MLTLALTSRAKVQRIYAPTPWWQHGKPIEDMQLNEALAVLQAARSCDICAISITGGDPFAVPALLMPILKEISQSTTAWVSVSIQTFGVYAVTDQIWEYLCQCGPALTLVIELDTMDSATYKTIYGKDALKSVQTFIDNARMRNIHVRIRTVLTSLNKDAITHIVQYAKEKDCDMLLCDLATIMGKREPVDLFIPIATVQAIVTQNLQPAGFTANPGGFGLPIQMWHLSGNRLLGLQASSSSPLYHPACAMCQQMCANGGYPLLILPGMYVHLCNYNSNHVVPLGDNTIKNLSRVLSGFLGPFSTDTTSEDRRGGGIPSGATLHELISPVDQNNQQLKFAADAIDLSIDKEYRVLSPWRLGRGIDAWNLTRCSIRTQDRIWPLRKMPLSGIWVKPHTVVYSVSRETITVPSGYIGLVLGRATWARLGLQVCCDVAKIQSGRTGRVQFHLTNNNRMAIRILPYMFIAQIVFFPVTDAYPLKGEQYNEDEGVYSPVKGLNLQREIGPSVQFGRLIAIEKTGKKNILPALLQGENGSVDILKLAERFGLLRHSSRMSAAKKKTLANLTRDLIGPIVGLFGGMVVWFRTNLLWAGIVAFVIITVVLIVVIVIYWKTSNVQDDKGDKNAS